MFKKAYKTLIDKESDSEERKRLKKILQWKRRTKEHKSRRRSKTTWRLYEHWKKKNGCIRNRLISYLISIQFL